MNCHSFVLQQVPPFRLDLTIWTLRRRPDNAVDRWDGRTYWRVLVLSGLVVEVAATQIKPPGDLQLLATVSGPPPHRRRESGGDFGPGTLAGSAH